ncbi:FMN-binding protein [Desulfofustis limnaeus]|uniref:Ion-translocating oxidoreductase complex subunit G n=1 Tax=Desulfofustis limnaeus TaxID=2740163 RepID=A0ABM7WE90_9BACT|nr:FMN-binding protein [Desulfofustis limnaeus]MDX9894924.1 FMN-binding protein [Desulfofustis sp.]BDD89298.1 electron transport complex subunit G [Desulfofustis limnaeus]
MSEIVRMVVVLSLIAGICSAILTFADQSLAPRIEQQTDYYVRGPALERLFGKPATEVLNNKVTIPLEGAVIPVFFSKQGDDIATLAIEATGKGGFGGDLKLMFGVDLRSGRQTGLEVVSHSETPGLGARIEEVSFRRQWQGLPTDKTVALTKDGGDIDGISGATTTSRAAVAGTNDVLQFLRDHKDQILQSISKLEERI